MIITDQLTQATQGPSQHAEHNELRNHTLNVKACCERKRFNCLQTLTAHRSLDRVVGHTRAQITPKNPHKKTVKTRQRPKNAHAHPGTHTGAAPTPELARPPQPSRPCGTCNRTEGLYRASSPTQSSISRSKSGSMARADQMACFRPLN